MRGGRPERSRSEKDERGAKRNEKRRRRAERKEKKKKKKPYDISPIAAIAVGGNLLNQLSLLLLVAFNFSNCRNFH